MKFRDMLRMSGSSLWKRKVRTILTVLGVVIGTASIVVMISLGLGLSRASLAEIEQYGGITTITVEDQGSGGYMEEESSDSQAEDKHLNDDVIEEIRNIPHVEDVYGVLETEALAMCGGFQTYVSVRGVEPEKMDKLGITLAQGSFPEPDAGYLQAVYGNMIIGDFYNEKTGEGYWYNGELPDIDLMNDSIIFVFDVDSYYNFIWGGGESEDGSAPVMPKKRIVEAAGIMEGTVEDYGSNSYYVYFDINELKKILKKEYKNRAIPGQPTTSSGKPFKEIYYSSIMVNVDDMDYVQEVQNQITQLGYHASSNAEWVESMQGQYFYIELALGGIGAVSLIVAAIGIANTMMMSIYERTKEIGIMKVLGCDMRNIQGMFLMEAGYIGFIGGALGILLSYTISFTINAVIKNLDLGMEMNMAVGISYIPLWLAGLALVFAVFVGMAAGFFPSLRAMKLSPLAAIRNE